MYGPPKTTAWNEEMLQQALRNTPAWDNEGALPPWEYYPQEYYPQGELYKPPLPSYHLVDFDRELIQRMREALKKQDEQRAREQREAMYRDLGIPTHPEVAAAQRIAGAIADYYASMQVVRWHVRAPRPSLNLKTPYLLPSLETQSSLPYEWSTTPIPAMAQDVYMVQDLYPSSPFKPSHHFLGLPEPEPLEIPFG